MTQPKQLGRMQTVKFTNPNEYVSQRARGVYVASLTQPEMAFPFSFAAQTKEPSQDDYDLLNQAIQWQVDNQFRGLVFQKVDPENAQLFVFVDASFANNPDLTSQLGYLLIIGSETKLLGEGNCHWQYCTLVVTEV